MAGLYVTNFKVQTLIKVGFLFGHMTFGKRRRSDASASWPYARPDFVSEFRYG